MDDLVHDMTGVGSSPCHLEFLVRRSCRNTLVQLSASSSDVGDPVSSKWWMVVHLTGVSVVVDWDYGFERNTMLQHLSEYPLNTLGPSSDRWNLRCRFQRRRPHDQFAQRIAGIVLGVSSSPRIHRRRVQRQRHQDAASFGKSLRIRHCNGKRTEVPPSHALTCLQHRHGEKLKGERRRRTPRAENTEEEDSGESPAGARWNSF